LGKSIITHCSSLSPFVYAPGLIKM